MSPGAAGWIAVGVAVLAAELLDTRTMSEAFRAASKNPVTGPVMLAAWGVLTAHLFGFIPPDYDPIHLFWLRIRNEPCLPTSGRPGSSPL